MGNRCLNDIFSYCTGEPKATNRTEDYNVCGQPDPKKIGKGNQRTTGDGRYIIEERTFLACKLNIASCGCYLKESERSEK